VGPFGDLLMAWLSANKENVTSYTL